MRIPGFLLLLRVWMASCAAIRPSIICLQSMYPLLRGYNLLHDWLETRRYDLGYSLLYYVAQRDEIGLNLSAELASCSLGMSAMKVALKAFRILPVYLDASATS